MFHLFLFFTVTRRATAEKIVLMWQEELKHFCLGATTKEPLQAVLAAKCFQLQQI